MITLRQQIALLRKSENFNPDLIALAEVMADELDARDTEMQAKYEAAATRLAALEAQ